MASIFVCFCNIFAEVLHFFIRINVLPSGAIQHSGMQKTFISWWNWICYFATRLVHNGEHYLDPYRHSTDVSVIFLDCSIIQCRIDIVIKSKINLLIPCKQIFLCKAVWGNWLWAMTLILQNENILNFWVGIILCISCS